jgi:hypothetical protein
METLLRLQDTTAQIRARRVCLPGVFVVLASKFGLEAILGAYDLRRLLRRRESDRPRDGFGALTVLRRGHTDRRLKDATAPGVANAL